MSALSKDYSAEFEIFYNSLDRLEEIRGMKSFHLRQRHDFFGEVQLQMGPKMLEFGGGPVIYSGSYAIHGTCSYTYDVICNARSH